jgi:uncharacterized protein YbjQ (UPF0145 family)
MTLNISGKERGEMEFKRKVIFFAIILVALITFGCGTFVPVTDVSKVPKETLQQAYKVKTFMAGSNVNHPQVKEFLGEITAYSCKHLLWDPPASKGDALSQLRLKALEMGADGIIDVTFDSRGTDAFGTNCWESVQASGVAVKFEQ